MGRAAPAGGRTRCGLQGLAAGPGAALQASPQDTGAAGARAGSGSRKQGGAPLADAITHVASHRGSGSSTCSTPGRASGPAPRVACSWTARWRRPCLVGSGLPGTHCDNCCMYPACRWCGSLQRCLLCQSQELYRDFIRTAEQLVKDKLEEQRVRSLMLFQGP